MFFKTTVLYVLLLIIVVWTADVTTVMEGVDCESLVAKYKVVLDKSWGTLPLRYIKTWDKHGCDAFLRSRLPTPPPVRKFLTKEEEAKLSCDGMLSYYNVSFNESGIRQDWGVPVKMPVRVMKRWDNKECEKKFWTQAVHNPPPGRPTIFPTFAPTVENFDADQRLQHITTVIAECDGGFGNRLRSLFFFMYLASWKYNAKLMYIWEVNDACPGHFLSIYAPLENVTFITRQHARELFAGSQGPLSPVVRFRNSRQNIEFFANSFKIPVNYNEVLGMGMAQLRLLEPIHAKIYDFVTRNDICNAVGLHVRRTDLHDELPAIKRMSYENTFWFVHSYPGEGITLFVATDNADTQQVFRRYWGSNQTKVKRLLFYADIDGERANKAIGSGKVSTEYRHTDLETAIIDMYVLSYTKAFRQSLYSSYSGWVLWLREKWRKGVPTCLNSTNPRIV
jgi:hypothetical protein